VRTQQVQMRTLVAGDGPRETRLEVAGPGGGAGPDYHEPEAVVAVPVALGAPARGELLDPAPATWTSRRDPTSSCSTAGRPGVPGRRLTDTVRNASSGQPQPSVPRTKRSTS
jgi:hypothetical protein